MQKLKQQGRERKISFIERFKRWVFRRLMLTNDPVIKVYNGYGNSDKLTVFGHALKLSPLPRKKYRKNVFTNSYGLLRLFMTRPLARSVIRLAWEGQVYETNSETDGFFKFDWDPGRKLDPGWYFVNVSIVNPSRRTKFTEARGDVLVPYVYKNAFISDIDDTFLISHSHNLRKRLYVLLTKNARSRKPFESVVKYYQLLSCSGTKTGTFNAFFYVSSSEWNLYDYISEFSNEQKLPKGIYLLSQMKKFSQLWKTGQNNHSTKFTRIIRILEAYPDQQFVLFGDDSQKDPSIYFAIAEYFPGKITAIYIRHVRNSSRDAVMQIQRKLQDMKIPLCYFTHSSEAITHSKSIGIIR